LSLHESSCSETERRSTSGVCSSARSLENHPSPCLGVGQLLLGGVTLLVIGLTLVAKLMSVLWVLAPLFAMVVLATIHERVLKRRGRCLRTVAYYERALARIDNRWMGTGETGERFQNASHPYSRDLDLFGVGSLFDLLCTARTRVGQETLAQWLLAPASPAQVRARQEAVVDLRSRLDLREDLAVLAEEAGSLAPAEVLATWGEGKPLLASPKGPWRCCFCWTSSFREQTSKTGGWARRRWCAAWLSAGRLDW